MICSVCKLDLLVLEDHLGFGMKIHCVNTSGGKIKKKTVELAILARYWVKQRKDAVKKNQSVCTVLTN